MASSPTYIGRPYPQITGRRKMLRAVVTSVGSPHLEATSEREAPSVTSRVPQRKPSAKALEQTRSPTAIAANARFMGQTIGPSSLTDNEHIDRTFSPGSGTHEG